ncbi:demethoxyubiquinone hydroxylase family protein [Geosporobacter ferrireducens]|uniref:Ubiquinone biosynthesis protein COQ7 n=1 Tax=Geosporobacter ferrireducens TaxID=1424294 RepID=A0A1D8GDC8_9FIRM|nr:demethoxyubiquinone hydroxylase family protein [Geosporobacter ferrireducens]AOT68904.1 ubiquinone biosynthesis protein COQ7 [Geosporobacter ferrireducens]MTI54860.1 ubiquinone biosynthesis protein COQ7 [Geosporobacter ferrireducens]
MPSFPNPFAGNVDRKISKEELVQAIRLDIAGELEAIYVYDAHVQATDDPIAKRVLADIRDEEKAHVGELMALLRILDPKEGDLFEEGQEEVREMLAELGIEEKKIEYKSNVVHTVGSLLEE